jgi:hypothetical protein
MFERLPVNLLYKCLNFTATPGKCFDQQQESVYKTPKVIRANPFFDALLIKKPVMLKPEYSQRRPGDFNVLHWLRGLAALNMTIRQEERGRSLPVLHDGFAPPFVLPAGRVSGGQLCCALPPAIAPHFSPREWSCRAQRDI